MADCMAVYGLRHQRYRLAGEVSRFKHHNRRYQAEINRLMAQITENNARIEAITARIGTLGEAALVAFSTPLGLPVPR